jgi:phosphate transport system protein
MTQIKIEKDLSKIYKSLGKMTSYIDESFSRMILAISRRDEELAQAVMDDDEKVNAMELKINHDCILFIAKNQPVARDLRVVASIYKIITDLERIGDNLADISKYVGRLKALPISDLDNSIITMANDVRTMVTRAIRSFINTDIKEAYEVIDFDDIIDERYHELKREVVKAINEDENREHTYEYVTLAAILKYLEKIADHAENIAEWIIYNVSGEYSA